MVFNEITNLQDLCHFLNSKLVGMLALLKFHKNFNEEALGETLQNSGEI